MYEYRDDNEVNITLANAALSDTVQSTINNRLGRGETISSTVISVNGDDTIIKGKVTHYGSWVELVGTRHTGGIWEFRFSGTVVKVNHGDLEEALDRLDYEMYGNEEIYHV